MKHVADFYVPLAWRNDYCGIEKLTLQGLDFYFVDNESYFKRDSLYGYFDDGERFAFFAKAVCEAIARVPELECDVLHCNDWQTVSSTARCRPATTSSASSPCTTSSSRASTATRCSRTSWAWPTSPPLATSCAATRTPSTS